MKKLAAVAFFAIANFAVAGSSFAQTHAVKANIPFDFTVGNELLPAGTYVIKSETGHIVQIKNLDKPVQALGLSMPDHTVGRGDHKLVFNKYRDQYFLRKVVSEDAEMDLRLPVSKSEKKTQQQEAAIGSSSQTNVATR